jgi:hypothetical protein
MTPEVGHATGRDEVEDEATPDEERTGREMPEDEGIPDLDQALPEKEITGDPQEGLVVPRDDPRAVEESGTTAEEQREGEPLDERLAREEDETGSGLRKDAGTLVENGSGLTDEEKDEVGEAAPSPEGRSAEEEAVRIEDEAPGGVERSDSYVEEEEG